MIHDRIYRYYLLILRANKPSARKMKMIFESQIVFMISTLWIFDNIVSGMWTETQQIQKFAWHSAPANITASAGITEEAENSICLSRKTKKKLVESVIRGKPAVHCCVYKTHKIHFCVLFRLWYIAGITADMLHYNSCWWFKHK